MKISSNNQQLQQLNKEKDILDLIKRGDIRNESHEFIVGWLYPSQFLTHNNNNSNNNSNNSNNNSKNSKNAKNSKNSNSNNSNNSNNLIQLIQNCF